MVRVAVIVGEWDRVLMLWQYRFAADQWGYELPGGLVEEGKKPATTAAREAERVVGGQRGA